MFREGVKPVRELWEGHKCKDVPLTQNTVGAVQKESHLFFSIQEAHSCSFE